MYPLKNLQNYTIGFRFKTPYPNRQPFIKLGMVGKPHLGVDILTPIGTPLYAPFDGVVTYVWGSDGGHQAYFRATKKIELHRFLHLNVPPKTGLYKEGQQFGVTGNSGAATTTPHLHHDISKNGVLNLGNINNFTDPLTFNYSTPNPMNHIKLKVLLIMNNSDWPSLQVKLDQIKDWYKSNSTIAGKGSVELEFDVMHTSHLNIPFEDYDTLPDFFAWGVERQWQGQNIRPFTYGYDIVIFHMRNIDWQNQGNSQTQGVMLGDLYDPPRCNYINQHADEGDNGAQIMFGSHFNYLVCHEVSHAMLGMTGQDWDSQGQNVTHKRFYSQNFVDAPKIFEDSNYQSLSNVLAIRRQGEPMLIINNTSNPGTKFALSSDAKIGFADFPAYQKFVAGRTVVNITLPDLEFNKIPTSQAVIKT